MAEYADIDWEQIAPGNLRAIENFPLLLDTLTARFLPNRSLRKSQVRSLLDRYSAVNEQLGSIEGVKELVRLILALPEYQIQ
jgi:hypothetical protein